MTTKRLCYVTDGWVRFSAVCIVGQTISSKAVGCHWHELYSSVSCKQVSNRAFKEHLCLITIDNAFVQQ